MNIVLCGHKGCGKSSAGRLYAERFNLNFIDTDDLMVAHYAKHYQQHLSISQIYQQLGATNFRALEETVVTTLTSSQNTVIATGGGIVMNPACVKHLKTLGPFVYIAVSAQCLLSRLKTQDRLPAFLDANDLANSLNQYWQTRKSMYDTLADKTVTADHLGLNAVVEMIHQSVKAIQGEAKG